MPRIPLSGILLVLLGALFLADQFHVLSFGTIFSRWWPAILVLAGVLNLLERPSSVMFPVIMIVVGVAVLLNKLGYLPFTQAWKLWPIVLIAVGVSILASSRRGRA